MAGNLTGQVRNIAEVTTAVARGDLSRKITVDVKVNSRTQEHHQHMVDQSTRSQEKSRASLAIGYGRQAGGQAQVPGVAGTCKDLPTTSTSWPATSLAQVRNIAEVATAVARGDLSRKDHSRRERRILELKDTINTMVDQCVRSRRK